MRNVIGFANRKGYPAPTFYQVVFNSYCAVYFAEDGTEYHLQLRLPAWGWQDIDPRTGLQREAEAVEVLVQLPTYRNYAVTGPDRHWGFPTVKGALEALVPLLGRAACAA